MASGGQFAVDPEALQRAAGAFDESAARLAGTAHRFAAWAQPGGETFGLLPEARAARERYAALGDQAREALAVVDAALTRSLAGGLRSCAANYLRADRDSISR